MDADEGVIGVRQCGGDDGARDAGGRLESAKGCPHFRHTEIEVPSPVQSDVG